MIHFDQINYKDFVSMEKGEWSSVFKTCVINGHGQFVSEIFHEKGEIPDYEDSGWSGCPLCEKETQSITLSALRSKKQDSLKNESIDSRIKTSGIPERFIFSSLQNFVPRCFKAEIAAVKCMDYATDFEKNSKKNKSMMFCGSPGTGKTHLACAIAMYLICNKQCNVVFTTMSKLLRSIKQTYSNSKSMLTSEQDQIDAYCAPDLLIIDEIGMQFGTHAEKIIIFEIINERYNNFKPVILITNEQKENVSGIIGESCIDRLRENKGFVLAFDWESERCKK